METWRAVDNQVLCDSEYAEGALIAECSRVERARAIAGLPVLLAAAKAELCYAECDADCKERLLAQANLRVAIRACEK